MCAGVVYEDMPEKTMSTLQAGTSREIGRTDNHSRRTGVPVRREETTESGDEVEATGVGHPSGECVDVLRRRNHVHRVTEPLDSTSCDTD